MFNSSHSQTGAGRYFQCHGALSKMGPEIAYYGQKVLLLFDSHTVKEKTLPAIEKSLADSNIERIVCVFEEPATISSFQKAADEIKANGCQAVAGIGGGKIIDIAKASGELAGVNIFTVPTSAATCAAFAVIFVAYNEDGSIHNNDFLQREVSGVFVDLDIVVKDCPVRYFASGIADALAKLPEFTFTTLMLGSEGQRPPVDAAMLLAEYTYKTYLEKGEEAVKAFIEKRDTPLLDDIVNLNIYLTGLISDLSTGGKSLMICHNFYDAICNLHPDVRKNFLHGELVGLAIPLQAYVNGAPHEEIIRVQTFLKSIGIPVSLDEIEFPEDDASLDQLIRYIYWVTGVNDEALLSRINEGFKYLKANPADEAA